MPESLHISSAIYWGILMGLPGSLHCIGMCGPLALMVGSGKKNPFLASIIYHLGRSLGYFLVGLLAGVVFQVVDLKPFQQELSIVIGLIFLLLWLSQWFKIKGASIEIGWNKIIQTIPRLLAGGNYITLLTAGFVNGWLPCGLVYSALLVSMSTADTMQSGLVMFGFGLGTIPSLFIITAISAKLKQKITQFWGSMMKFWLLIMAIIFILRGAGLGIPYVSPKFQQKHIQEDCCNPRH